MKKLWLFYGGLILLIIIFFSYFYFIDLLHYKKDQVRLEKLLLQLADLESENNYFKNTDKSILKNNYLAESYYILENEKLVNIIPPKSQEEEKINIQKSLVYIIVIFLIATLLIIGSILLRKKYQQKRGDITVIKE